MSNVDPRLELARQIAANRRMPSIAPMAPTGGGPVARKTLGADVRAVQSQVQDTTTELLGRFPSLSDQIEAIAKNKPMGGVKGALVGALNSTPGKILIKPLEVLDIGRRGVISGARELVDALDSDPKTRASLRDFSNQVSDPTFGFGKAFPVKGKLGYVTGFLGDVLLDPLTYATLGTSQVAGLAARTAMATKYLDRFGDAAKAAQIVQRGKTVMNASEIADLGLKRSGVYFFGERLRVPLSGPVGEAMLSGVTKARIGFTNTRFGKTLQKGFMGMGANGTEALRDIRLALARGERLPNDISAEAGLRIVASEDIRRSVAAEAVALAQRRMAQELDNVGDDQINAYGKVAYKWLEGSAVPQNATEQAFADRFKGLFQELWDNVNEDFKQLVPDDDLAKITEYFPWVLTREARDLTTDMQSDWVKGLASFLEPNPLDRTGSFKSRNLKAGAEFLWTVDDTGKRIPYKLTPEDLNIERLNEISRGALGVDFFETDLRMVLQDYSTSFGRQKGLLAMYKELQDKGVIRSLTERNVVDEEMANAFVESVNATIRSAMSTLDSAGTTLKQAVKTITDDARARVGAAPAAIAGADEALRIAAAAADPVAEAAAVARVTAARESISTLRDEITGMQERLGALFAGGVPEELTPVIDNYERTKLMLKQFEDDIAARQERIEQLTVQRNSGLIQGELDGIEEATLQAVERLEDVSRRHQLFMSLNEIVSERYDDIINGVSPRDADLKRTVGIIKGSGRLVKRPDAPLSIEGFAKGEGTYKSWAQSIQTRLGNEEWFKTVSNFVASDRFSVRSVSRTTYNEVVDLAVSATPTFDRAYDLLNAAGFLLARDLKFYGTEGNSSLAAVRQKLVDSLDKASKAIAIKDGESVSSDSLRAMKNLRDDYDFLYRELQYSANAMRILDEAIDDTIRANEIPSYVFANSGNADALFGPEDFERADVLDLFISQYDPQGFVAQAKRARDSIASTPLKRADGTNYVGPSHRGKGNVQTTEYYAYDLDYVTRKLDESTAKYERARNSRISLPKEIKDDPQKMAELERGFAETIRDLSDNVLAYALSSEVERRFTALGVEFASYGLAPTKEMYGAIVRVVGEQFYQQTASRAAAVSKTIDSLSSLRDRVMNVVASKGNWVDEFNKGIAELYDGPNGEALVAVIGPDPAVAPAIRQARLRRETVASAAREPYYQASGELLNVPVIREAAQDLGMTSQWLNKHGEKIAYRSFLRKIIGQIEADDFDFGSLAAAEVDSIKSKVANIRELSRLGKESTEEYDEILREWFANTFPNSRYSVAAVDRALGESPASSVRAMRIWFTERIGGYYRHGASTPAARPSTRFSTRGGKNAALTKQHNEGDFIAEFIEGSLRNEQRSLDARMTKLNNVTDPSSKVDDFMNDPFGVEGGPLSYEKSLRLFADRIAQDLKIANPAVVRNVEKALKQYQTANARRKYLEDFIDKRLAIQGEDVAEILGLKTGATLDVDLFDTDPITGKLVRKRAEETAQEYRQRVIDSLSNSEGVEYLLTDKGFRKVLELNELLSETSGVRKVRKQISDITKTEQYIMATHERDFYEFMSSIAGLDGWRMIHPRRGESGWFLDDTTVADVAKSTAARRAIYISPESQEARAQILGRLFQDNVLSEEVYRDLLWFGGRSRPIDSLPTALKDKIGPNIMAALRNTEDVLTFTQQEWTALFQRPSAQLMARTANRQGQIKKELASLQKSLNAGKTFTSVDGTRIKISNRIQQLNAESVDNAFILESGRAEVYDLAMRKARELFRQVEEGAPSSLKTSKAKTHFNKIKSYSGAEGFVSDKAAANARRANLKTAWEASDDFKVLDKVKTLENSEELKTFKNAVGALRNLRSAQYEAEEILADALQPLSDASNSIVSLLESTSFGIEQAVRQGGPDVFSPEGLQLLESVKAHVQQLLAGAPELGGRLNVTDLRGTLPKQIRDAAKVIGETYVSPLEREFARAISGVNPNQQLADAAWQLARLKGAHSYLLQGQKAVDDEIASLSFEISEKAVRKAPKTTTSKRTELPPGFVWVRKQGTNEFQRVSVRSLFEDSVKQLNKAIGDWHKLTRKEIADTTKRMDLKSGELADAVVELDHAQSALDNILPNLIDAETTVAYMQNFVEPKIRRLEELLERMKTVRGNKKNIFSTPENYRDILDVVEDFRVVYNDLLTDPNDPVFKALADVANVNAQYMNILNNVTYVRNIESATLADASFTRVEQVIDEGFAALEIAVAGDPKLQWAQAPKEVVDFFVNSRRLKDPQFQRGVMRFLQNYTKFFKSYATLSPGFHVRNAMSNTFALVAAGGDPRNFTKGLQLYRSFSEAMNRNLSVEQWVATLPQADREVARVAARSMYASGGGQVSEAFVGMARRSPGFKGKVEENALLRTSRKVGGTLESSSRFILGYDSAVKGMDFNTASARVRRHMVDYEDVGTADEVLRTIIPFWMWTSRALPMHLTNQWLNPRPYAIYESFKRNVGRDDENEIVPSWVTEQGGFRIASKTYLMPDLGFNRLEQQIAQLGDFSRFASQANPLLRLPYELVGGEKLYTGQPFSGEPQQVEGGVAALLQPLLQIAGYGETGPDGKKFVDEKALYALQNLIPFLAQGERLMPSTEGGKERQSGAVMGYLGVPVRQITERQERGELLRQLNELRQLQARQEAVYGDG